MSVSARVCVCVCVCMCFVCVCVCVCACVVCVCACVCVCGVCAHKHTIVIIVFSVALFCVWRERSTAHIISVFSPEIIC